MLKDISSTGSVSTVDVIYPMSPVLLYTNPAWLKLLLDPILDYSERGTWPKPFAVHDLGSAYPKATGHDDGVEKDMPIEESANMLLMMAAYAQRAKPDVAAAFANAHYKIAKQWADYLVPITLDPTNQAQTDDFAGPIDHSANLALKGILGIGAMAILAKMAGNTADAEAYANTSKDLIAKWVTKATDPSKTHLVLKYDAPGTWSLKYNAFYDAVLGMKLVPQSVIDMEKAWYDSVAAPFGIPLDPRHTFTRVDWELWTAAVVGPGSVRDKLIDGVYTFATESSTRCAFTDWYDAATALRMDFEARPVIGGMFSLLALKGGPIIAP
jgi:hypothetical protein